MKHMLLGLLNSAKAIQTTLVPLIRENLDHPATIGILSAIAGGYATAYATDKLSQSKQAEELSQAHANCKLLEKKIEEFSLLKQNMDMHSKQLVEKNTSLRDELSRVDRKNNSLRDELRHVDREKANLRTSFHECNSVLTQIKLSYDSSWCLWRKKVDTPNIKSTQDPSMGGSSIGESNRSSI